MLYDVAIIGGGIVGSSIARCLSKYNLKICIIEKENDISCGTSKANSGIIHAGYDPVPETLMARLNIQGSEIYPEWAEQLDFEYKRTGSLVIAFSDTDFLHLKKLYERGTKNGVGHLRIISKTELQKIEPNVNSEATGALFAETAAIISPYQTVWAITENAIMNGTSLFCNTEVHDITNNENTWICHTGRGDIQSHYLVNAAGLFADEISKMAGARNFVIKPRKGEYFLLDSNCGNIVHHTLFQVPNEKGKGVLITPTVDGNILVGPTADDSYSKSDTSTTAYGQDSIFKKAAQTVLDIPKRNIINSFSGIRAVAYTPLQKDQLFSNSESPTSDCQLSPVGDFIIEEDSQKKGFINVAGICSPGLSAAPAIGIYVAELLGKAGLKLEQNENYISNRKGIESFKNADKKRKEELIKENSLYGRIICRCEMITEAEIIKAIHSLAGANDLDGVKRRTRAGMGRCQGGFCSPRVTEIISRELNIPMTSVTKTGGCSFILNSKTRG